MQAMVGSGLATAQQVGILWVMYQEAAWVPGRGWHDAHLVSWMVVGLIAPREDSLPASSSPSPPTHHLGQGQLESLSSLLAQAESAVVGTVFSCLSCSQSSPLSPSRHSRKPWEDSALKVKPSGSLCGTLHIRGVPLLCEFYFLCQLWGFPELGAGLPLCRLDPCQSLIFSSLQWLPSAYSTPIFLYLIF